jgi:hypothetical protein
VSAAPQIGGINPPCAVPGHDHVEACSSDMGYALPFCDPHFAALPTAQQRKLIALAGASIYEIEQHGPVLVAYQRARQWLIDHPGVPGVCSKCGCTEEYGCDGGCSWSDKGRTLCSRCVPARTPKRGRARGAGEKRPARRQ